MDNQSPIGQNQNVFNQTQIQINKGKFKSFLNLSSWIFLFTLLPITVLIFLSQDSIPGNFFYPVKRGMENVILAAASVSPATRAAFRTDLTTRRFDEAEKLLLSSSGANGLKDFVSEVQAAQNEVSAISDTVKREELQQKIQISVTDYEKRLDKVKVELIAQISIQPEPTSAVFLPTNTPTPIVISKPEQPSIPTNTPVPFPTSTPKPPTLSNPQIATPTKAQTIPVPVQTPTPTMIPTPTVIQEPLLPPVTPGETTIGTVDKVRDYLRCLQNTPPPHRECIAPDISSVNPNSENKQEKRKEEKEKRERKKENEGKDAASDQNSNLKNTHQSQPKF